MTEQSGRDHRLLGVRNPFGVTDVPDAEDDEVAAFAATVTLDGSTADENAGAWGSAGDPRPSDDIEGLWSSRWNGGADPTIPGDAANLWKQGEAELKSAGDRIYLLFDWHERRPLGAHPRAPLWRRPAGRQIRQPDQSEHHAPVDGPDREQLQDRRTLAGRTSRFPPTRPAWWRLVSVIVDLEQREGAEDVRHRRRRRRMEVLAVEIGKARHAEQAEAALHLVLQKLEHAHQRALAAARAVVARRPACRGRWQCGRVAVFVQTRALSPGALRAHEPVGSVAAPPQSRHHARTRACARRTSHRGGTRHAFRAWPRSDGRAALLR